MALLTPPGIITQRFGIAVPAVALREPAMWYEGTKRAYWLRFPGSAYSAHYHGGVDYSAPLGTPLPALEAATVIEAGYANSISGYHVVCEIRPGVRFGFNHGQKVLVRPGQKVGRGQTVMTMGQSGSATGPNTHAYLSIKEKLSDGVTRTMIYNLALFLAGGSMANDPRIKPIVGGITPTPPPTAKHVVLNGGGINIRTSADLDVGTTNIYATSRDADGTINDGIYARSNGGRLGALTYQFLYLRDVVTDDGAWVQVMGFSKTLYIFKSLVHFV